MQQTLNCKIYHGPYVYNFEEIYEIFKKNKISKKINNYDELSKNLKNDLKIQKKKIKKNSNNIKIGKKNINKYNENY